jgi:ubiquinone/menaquinone biosynthesis C-methylase UbiE
MLLYIRVLKASAVNTWRKKRSVMRRYDLTAQMYDSRYSEEQTPKYKAALERLILEAGSSILDVGCGSGLFFSSVATTVDKVVGVDASLKLLLIAKKRAKEFENVHLVRADADYPPFRQAVFSHIFAFTVLQNMPNPVKTLQELKNIAKRDAAFVVSGLKAAVSIDAFRETIGKASLQIVSVRDDYALRCYVVNAVISET